MRKKEFIKKLVRKVNQMQDTANILASNLKMPVDTRKHCRVRCHAYTDVLMLIDDIEGGIS